MKPLEFVIEKDFEDYYMRFYYEDKTTFLIQIEELPDGLKVGRHYHIDDMYGYSIIDDREGL